MTIFNYFTEIRFRIFYSLFSFIFLYFTCYYFSVELIYLFVKPFLNYENKFIFINLTEAFYTTLKLCWVVSITTIIPLFFYQIWCFIIPSFFYHEKKQMELLLYFLILILIGSCILFYSIFPVLCDFLLGYQIKNNLVSLQLQPRISSLLTVCFTLFFTLFFFLQTPLFFYILFYYKILLPQTVSIGRKYFMLFALLFSAFISPPDILAQSFLFFSFFLVFEISLWFGFLQKNSEAVEFISAGLK
uniref:SecY-independent transporter protein n=1 Tax=Lobosphaera incisa TaxID=312850 RepID=A0A0F6XQX9_9CHLO|nr:SecY-independent transporter protein [Lobosphaera incisa]AKF78657.1 SecY-independent transporter protein [Lobosphaera incisa]